MGLVSQAARQPQNQIGEHDHGQQGDQQHGEESPDFTNDLCQRDFGHSTDDKQ